MRQFNKAEFREGDTFAAGTTTGAEFFESVTGLIRRRWLAIAAGAVLGAGLGIIYVARATPSFTASTKLLVAGEKIPNAQLISAEPGNAMVGSQVEILKSDDIALAVIKQLHLIEDPDFIGVGWLGKLPKSTASSSLSKVPLQQESAWHALRAFKDRLAVKQAALTYVIDISFRASSPERAAEIANAVAQRYIDDQQ